MKSVKCECTSCGYIQWLEEDTIEDCESCGFFINANEDKVEE